MAKRARPSSVPPRTSISSTPSPERDVPSAAVARSEPPVMTSFAASSEPPVYRRSPLTITVPPSIVRVSSTAPSTTVSVALPRIVSFG